MSQSEKEREAKAQTEGKAIFADRELSDAELASVAGGADKDPGKYDGSGGGGGGEKKKP